MSSGAATADGRVRRGEANRAALVEALLALYDTGTLSPTAAQIAARAGVAVRSVYGHFGDVESLAAEVSERQWQRYRHLMDGPEIMGKRAARVARLVERRAQLFEAIAPVRRAALLHVHHNETIATNLHQLAGRLRAQVATTFATELDALAVDRAADLLDTLDLLLAWESWERLRSEQGRSITRARRVLAGAVHRLLDPDGSSS